MSSGAITLSPLSHNGAVDGDVIAMMMEASRDPDIRNQSYLVHILDEQGAREYCQKNEGVAIRLDGAPIGATILHDKLPVLEGIELPRGSCVELDTIVLARARGRGLVGKRGAYPLVAAWLAPRFDRGISIIFADNLPALVHVRAIGGKLLGRTYLPSGGIPGYRSGEVEVYAYEFAPYRTNS